MIASLVPATKETTASVSVPMKVSDSLPRRAFSSAMVVNAGCSCGDSGSVYTPLPTFTYIWTIAEVYSVLVTAGNSRVITAEPFSTRGVTSSLPVVRFHSAEAIFAGSTVIAGLSESTSTGWLTATSMGVVELYVSTTALAASWPTATVMVVNSCSVLKPGSIIKGTVISKSSSNILPTTLVRPLARRGTFLIDLSLTHCVPQATENSML